MSYPQARSQVQVQPMNRGPVHHPGGANGHPMVPHPGANVDPPCKFTCCFCIGCEYTAKCVYKTFHACDTWWFGWWGIQGFFYLGTGLGMYALIGAAIGLAFLALAALAIMNCLKLDENQTQRILNHKTNTYLSWRFRSLMVLLGTGIGLGILYFILIYVVGKSAIESASGGNAEVSEAASAILFTAALYVCLAVSISYGSVVACLMGCKKSATDSLALLGEKGDVPMNAHGNGNASVIMGEVSVYDPNHGPVYGAKPDAKGNAKLQMPPIGAPPVMVTSATGPPMQPQYPAAPQKQPQYQQPAQVSAPQGATVQMSASPSPAKTATKSGAAAGTGGKKFKAAPK